ncbi:MAG TPA: SDR family oxidoreductase [Tepidisphaeraceae bacterium]|jgi:NAD(P)-dependent dehydrogenase (short-subunit alcohol dehydrogenase family)
MAGELAERVVVIIGGTAGLGLSAAKACIAAGARVVALGRDDDAAGAARDTVGSRGLVLTGDATHPSTASAAIDAAFRTFGRFDALYHVAGGSGRRLGDGPLHEIADEGWRQTMDLNATSMFLSNRAAVRQFLAQKSGGSVLNVTSVLAFSPAPHHFATHAYAAAKSAAIGFTRSCAAHYASHGIRFNLIAPGLVDTPMARRAAGDEQIRRYIATKQPLDGGRIGHPADLDAAVVFFLSDQSRFVTGQILGVDGGWAVSEGQVAP